MPLWTERGRKNLRSITECCKSFRLFQPRAGSDAGLFEANRQNKELPLRPLGRPSVWTSVIIRSRGSNIFIAMTLLVLLLCLYNTPYQKDLSYEDDDDDAGTKSVKDVDEADDQTTETQVCGKARGSVGSRG